MSSFNYTVTVALPGPALGPAKQSTQACSTKLHITVRDKDGKVLIDKDAEES